eukprot:GHVS01070890.1.p1 GENE.GHVS01070890.1~~GHVS01070890.1.p1  ORF type:complete len:576 (+),score=139.79 GHVS01070890.1:15-1742(+)
MCEGLLSLCVGGFRLTSSLCSFGSTFLFSPSAFFATSVCLLSPFRTMSPRRSSSSSSSSSSQFFTFHVCLLLLTVPLALFFLLSCPAARAEASPVSSPPPSGGCPSCPDCSSQAHAAAQAEDRVAKMTTELSHLKQINEDSVKACNLVSQKQVESLEECQNSQQQLGEMFNKAQEQKQELTAKSEEMMKENIEKEITCAKRVEAAVGEAAKKTAEAEAKLMVAEQAGSSREEVETVRKELSGQLDGASGRIKELMEEMKRKENEHKLAKEAAGKVEGGMQAELAAEQKKHQSAEKSFQQAQGQLEYMRREMDSVKKKSSEGSSHLYSFRSFCDSVFGLRDLSLALCSSLYGRVQQSYKDYIHQTYTEYRLAFVDPFLAHPNTQQVLRTGGKQWETLKGLYSSHLGGENGHVAAVGKKVSSAMDSAQLTANEWNAVLTKGVLAQFIKEHPEVERLIPDGILDRSMCFLFILLAFMVAYKLMTMTVWPLTRFAICQICGCRMCARRDSSRATKRVHSTKKKVSSPTTSSSSSSSGQRKKPTESLQAGGGSGKAFRPDESSGTATTTSSSTGNGIKRK